MGFFSDVLLSLAYLSRSKLSCEVSDCMGAKTETVFGLECATLVLFSAQHLTIH